MSSVAVSNTTGHINSLDVEHRETFHRALANILSTDTAELTYAQLLDGLPTSESFTDSYLWLARHPVYELEHKQLCDGYLEQAKEYRAQFDPANLSFEQSLLATFRETAPGSHDFNMRLIELVVVACHQIAAYIFELDAGVHKHELHEAWLEQERPLTVDGFHEMGYYLPPSPFIHKSYCYPEQYPRGLADVAGYWAEGQIFGGVVVFDRGESERKCKSMWIHGAFVGGPSTLYPPTPEQFAALVRFLLADSDEKPACPLPIRGAPMNRPRWHPYDALARFHIFRDKYERKLPLERPRPTCRQSIRDWPEYKDQHFLAEQAQAEYHGLPVDQEGIDAANKRLSEVTPSSPCWFPK